MSTAFTALLPTLAVFPLHRIERTPEGRRCGCGRADCDDIGKHPDGPWGDISPGEKRRSRHHPHAGYGIATGERSGVFVIDLDGEAAIRAFYAMGPVPRTLTVRRGSYRGHLYFNWPGFPVKNSAGDLAPGVDVRGDRGYVVAPGSPHRSGDRYEVADDVSVADAPPWLLAWPGLQKADDGAAAPPSPVVAGSPEEAARIEEAVSYLSTAAPAVSGERGHNALWIVAQRLVRSIELPLETAYALIVEHYNDRCVPPWSDREIRHKLAQARDHGRFELRSRIEAFNAEILASTRKRR